MDTNSELLTYVQISGLPSLCPLNSTWATATDATLTSFEVQNVRMWDFAQDLTGTTVDLIMSYTLTGSMREFQQGTHWGLMASDILVNTGLGNGLLLTVHSNTLNGYVYSNTYYINPITTST